MTDCLACQRLERIREGADPFFIAELSESFAVLHNHQPYEGWCVLLLKDHAEHLHLLSAGRQSRLTEDIARASAAVAAAFSPRRINYECLGNQLAHVHWHIVPRYQAPKDPNPGAAIWVRPASELECGVTPEKRGEMIFRLQKAGLR